MGKVIYLGGYQMNTRVENEPAVKVAKWFLQNNDTLYASDGDSNLKLQKLLYYAQCMHLAVFEEPLYTEEVQAWENGPVIRNVYDQYRYKELGFKAMEDAKVKLSAFQEDLLRVVNIVYGSKSPTELIALTHEEKPWQELKRLVRCRMNPIITKERMKEYYKSLKDIFEAYRDYLVEECKLIIGTNTFTYRADIQITEEEKDIINDMSYDLRGSSLYISRDKDGGLVIY